MESEENGKKEVNGDEVEDKEHRSEQNLLSLMKSWDVETFLEQPEVKVCEYYKTSGSCPYQEVGCMFIHEAVQEDEDGDTEEEQEEEETKTSGTTHLRYKERLSARSRNRKVNEERFRRLRDLSISCP